MIAAMVVPFGRRSNASTSSRFDEDGAVAFADAGFVAAASIFGVGARPLALVVPLAPRGDLPAVRVALGFDLRAAI